MYQLSNINDNFYAVGTFSFDYQDKLLKGRPHGGTAILYKKWLKTARLKSKDDTICGLSIDCGNKTLCLINAYLPYYYSANVDGYLQYLSDLRSFCNEVSCPNICVMGDFNSNDSNGFCTYLNRFCKENGFILSDKQWLPNSTFTYISEAHGSVSWLDHCLTSTNVNKSICKVSILYDLVSSDHKPMAVYLKINSLPTYNKVSSNRVPYSVKWNKLKIGQKKAYE